MPVRIRLQRHGKKGKPFYWIVAADVRAKRDGKFLEKLGTYDPNTNPATIELNVDNSIKWLQNGAQPSHTAKRILSYKGAMLKYHLLGGVAKGALTEEEAQKKFELWVKDKELAISKKAKGIEDARAKAREEALKAEKEVSEKRTLAALTEEAETAEAAVEEGAEAVAEGTEEAPVTEEASPAEETPAGEPAAEETPAEAATEEAPAEEAKPEEPKAEAEVTPEASSEEE